MILGCSRVPATHVAPLPEPAVAAESARVTVIAPGVKHRYYWMARGPWAVNVLDVDRASCWSPITLKAGYRAVGREKTSVLISSYSDTLRKPWVSDEGRPTRRRVAGGVNGDFFAFVPPGVPVGPHIREGEVFAGSADRDVFAVDSSGHPFIGKLPIETTIHFRESTFSVRWNRPLANGVTFVNSRYSEHTDTATGALEIILQSFNFSIPPTHEDLRLAGLDRRIMTVVTEVDTAVAGVSLEGRFAIVAGAHADPSMRTALSQLAVGDTVKILCRFPGFRPLHAVGGFPVLMRDGAIAPETEIAGSTGFRNRNPRTAVAFDSARRRLLLVTVDGRQEPYSAGMTLTEMATLMRSLGASEALNLDGGGSTSFVVSDSSEPSRFRIMNRPSDKEGERPVANALAVRNACGPWLVQFDRPARDAR